MKSIVLVPYCPFPVDSGAKAEMWKHLKVLHSLGPCRIVTARKRPVGAGWTAKTVSKIRSKGFSISFREDQCRLSVVQWLGFCFGLFAKGLRMDRAFGHSNPYHRFAFPPSWWQRLSQKADLAVINYSYWARLPSTCPKVVVLHDLLSSFATEGHHRETRELMHADLVVTISQDEKRLLNLRGIRHILWSPPEVPTAKFPDNDAIGIIGSGNRFNVEGLRWMEKGGSADNLSIHIYGNLGQHSNAQGFLHKTAYMDPMLPYRECGIILMATAGGTGVQIKAVEALAAGRAIVARKGAMRGIPTLEPGWIEVSEPGEMLGWARQLKADKTLRNYWASRSAAYYKTHLDSDRVHSALKTAYSDLAR